MLLSERKKGWQLEYTRCFPDVPNKKGLSVTTKHKCAKNVSNSN